MYGVCVFAGDALPLQMMDCTQGGAGRWHVHCDLTATPLWW